MIDAEQARYRSTMRISPDHPSLPGHFPGHPVVPGVVILDEVIAAAERCIGHPLRMTGLPTAKFLSPLSPGREAVVEFSRRGSNWSFTVACGETAIARGVLHAEPAGAP